MSIRRIFQPLIMSTKSDGTVEYKPITTSDNFDDESVTNIFLPREDNQTHQVQNGGSRSFTIGSVRA